MASPPDNAPFRFSLRTLLVLTTCVAVISSVIGQFNNLPEELRVILTISFALAVLLITGALASVALAKFPKASHFALACYLTLLAVSYSYQSFSRDDYVYAASFFAGAVVLLVYTVRLARRENG